MRFDLDATSTLVTSCLSIKKQHPEVVGPLVLNGEAELISIALNETPLNPADYKIENNELKLLVSPIDDFKLTIVTKINPAAATNLEGLHTAGDILTTHCEPEGFRKITYYSDRPDVLATFTTEMHADKTKYPVLLSNGNLLHTADEADGKHVVIYHDPVPKPSYSFALVAGELVPHEDVFTTRSGKCVALKIFVTREDVPKTAHAMQALKAAMHFDEEHYDREYDLDSYVIVGVPEFSSSATECKGLNIFHIASLLAEPTTATDEDYANICTTIAHEYAHNWRGNRVTIKTWFELGFKEGWATMTEQEFSQHYKRSIVPRIEAITYMQDTQFSYDAGPLACAVIPEGYVATQNVYTLTAYYKGAELLTMLKLLVGEELFKAASSLFFSEYDGKATTITDFLEVIQRLSGKNLSQFLLWYYQAGTPELKFEEHYDATAKTYTLTVKQSCPPTPGQREKAPFLIPIAVGLLGSDGKEIPLQLEDESTPKGTTRLLELTQESQTFTFVGIATKPIPSLLRGFSAPVKIKKTPVSDEMLHFLLNYDSDPINRWLAARRLAKQAILKIIADMREGKTPAIEPSIIEAYRAILADSTMEPQLKCEMLTFPSLGSFMDIATPADPELIFNAREHFVGKFVESCYEELRTTYLSLAAASTSPHYSPESAAIRALKNQCLSYLMKTPSSDATAFCREQLHTATNMTDVLGALRPLTTYPSEERKELCEAELAAFTHKWQHNELALYHLFKLYASSEAPDALDQIIKLTKSPLFKEGNSDHVWYLLYHFCTVNPLRFHDPSGRAYEFIADYLIEIDKINPTSATYLAKAFAGWKKLEPTRQAKMLEQLFKLNEITTLSLSVKEIISGNVRAALDAKHIASMHRLFAGAAGADGGMEPLSIDVAHYGM